MQTSTPCTKILVGLDCLLDTRLGTLLFIDEDFGYAISRQAGYYTRQSDLFGTLEQGVLDREIYEQIKSSRAQEVLRSSISTRANLFLKELLHTQRDKLFGTPHQSVTELVVNLHPFKLTEDEQYELTASVISNITEGVCPVKLVDLSPEQLSVATVSTQYIAIMLYNPVAWIEANKDEFLKYKCKDVTLYTPRINHIRALTDEEINELRKAGMNIYSSIEVVMKPYIKYTYLDVGIFCADTPLNKPDR